MFRFFRKKKEEQHTAYDEMFNAVMGKVRPKMELEEGVRYHVYLDSLGFPTGGIGHLLTKEENKKYKVGQRLSKKQVEDWFKEDITGAIQAAMSQAKEVGEFEEDFVIALTSVNFQLGVNWPLKWPNTWRELKRGNYDFVVSAVRNSLWAEQTPKRTAAFVEALLVEKLENNRNAYV